jgi:Uma2 family endonuclease
MTPDQSDNRASASGIKPLKEDATYDDLCHVADRFIAEIVDGDLYASPRPPVRHIHAASVLAAELGTCFDWSRNGPGGWIVLNKPELHFGNDVLVPDITGWSRSRLPMLPNAAFMTLAPDWICEVLSPFTETLDRSKKLRIYAREGVEHAWLLDPVRKTLEVFELRKGTWAPLIEHEGGGKVRAPPFDAVEIELDALWT